MNSLKAISICEVLFQQKHFQLKENHDLTLREKCPNTKLFLVRIPVFGLNIGKYGQEVTSYLETFHAM